MYSSCSFYRLGDEALPWLFSFGEHTAVEASAVGWVIQKCEEWHLDFNGGWTEQDELGKGTERLEEKSRGTWILKAEGREGIV